MKQLLPALFLAFCGLAATAEAKVNVIEERILAVSEDGTLTLERSGNVVLGELVFPDNQAARFLEKKIGEPVKLTSKARDRYNRNIAEGELQEQLLKEGLAITYSKGALPERLVKAEAKGQAKWPQRWTVSAENSADHVGEFRLVEGKVLKATKTRDKMYVNFGEDWRQDFSITIPKRAWRSFGESLEGLEGKKLRVRGTIYKENGPMIAVSSSEQVEFLD